MIAYKNLVLVGTSHIAKQSIEEVEKTIKELKPESVALELDGARFNALINKEVGRLKVRHITLIGVKGYVFAKIGEFVERKLGKFVGVSPGSEMLKAAEVAKENNCKIALIDQKIEVTLKKFSKEITWREKFRFLVDIFGGVLGRKGVKIDLTKVPDKEFVRSLLKKVRKRYPNFYKVLVTDRNKFMAKKLFILMKNHSKIIAVVGAGHEEEIVQEIKRLEYAN